MVEGMAEPLTANRSDNNLSAAEANAPRPPAPAAPGCGCARPLNRSSLPDMC